MLKSNSNIQKNLLVIYLLGFYIILQFSWWAYLLLDLNTEITQQKIEIVNHAEQLNETFTENENIEVQLKDKLAKKKWMILGEGSIFLILLILGVRKIAKTVEEDFKLAQQQNNFLLSVTHELKSPLASSKLYLQTLLKRDLAKEKQTEILNKSLSDNERLNTLVNNILFATKINNAGYTIHKEELELSDFIKKLAEKQKIIFDKHEIIFNDPKEEFLVHFDKSALESIFLNLIENAVKYSPKSSKIEIDISKLEDKIVVKIKDEGNGIPENEKKLIFDKFYRIGDENTRQSKGTGLGLFIVKHLLKIHNASIVVKDNQPKGSIFEVYLSA
jgi:two-component system, OmpR family, phosphate regulon sensor histidine kinase PhoR